MRLPQTLAISCFACSVLAFSGSTRGQSNAPQIEVLMTISADLIDDFTNDAVTRSFPINRSSGGTPIRGRADAKGVVGVELRPNSERAEITLTFTGTATAAFRAHADPVTVRASTTAHFISKSKLTFDGTSFGREPTQTHTQNHTRIDGVCSRQSGCIGRIVRKVAGRVVAGQKREIDAAVQQATADMVTASFDESADELVDHLNVTAEFDETVATLFPETKEWVYHLATDPNSSYLIAGAGPKDAVFPKLPDRVSQSRVAPIEIWIKSSPLETALLQTVIVDWNGVQQALRGVLPEKEAQELAKQAAVIRIGDWSVIQVGD